MTDESHAARTRRKGRGALGNPHVRYESCRREPVDDGWGSLDEPLPPLETTVAIDRAKRVIAWNRSPDIPFDRSINPYRGCEHGCIYCYARPTHARYGLSPGQDFESRLLRKADAGARLRAELDRPRYQPAPMMLGANTDPYQPIEKRYRVTREVLEVLAEYRHPVRIVTKGSGIERDLDLLAEMAEWNGVSVMISLTSLDPAIKRTLEPRAAAPRRRIEQIRRLSGAGIPTGTLIAPVIPAITDHELEALLHAAAQAGAVSAGYVLLRLPQEVRSMFTDWLHAHYPDRAGHVLSLLRQAHGGREYDASFGKRMSGSGPYAQLLADRFRLACRQAGIDPGHRIPLCTSRFRRPPQSGEQGDLFA